MRNDNHAKAAGRTKRHDKIGEATGDMLRRITSLRPEYRAETLAQFLLFASHMAGIKVEAAREAHHG